MSDTSNGGAGRPSLSILTCSMPADLDLFALLARSVDDCVAPEIPHRVVVPRAAVPAFRRFATARREIIAQEDVIPFRLITLPALGFLTPLSQSFRRPIYLDPRLRMVRGWILQQLIKIEMTRRAAEAAVMHVDSDTFFVRPLAVADAFEGGVPRFFRIPGAVGHDGHRVWIETAKRLLGVEMADGYAANFIENCVLWSAEVAWMMTDRIEEVHAKPWHAALLQEPTLSEYFIYGVFADHLGAAAPLHGTTASFCNSFWPGEADAAYDVEAQLAKMAPGQCALAVQSTHPLPPEARTAIYETARARLP